ncbi:antiviral reverse transcriptase Drt3b [Neorhodopirellula pilleata]|uniref:Reverse transcriptase (RNA-dependent DNA polymerase) n=1 Tax=Neorhodopirellula pilleata TaxID=2714738 RepID=A0A5C5ZVP2_9BACT|nr:antiviral reverse transcriptase Drt3b [Neorhodopirellula pilleata]TWT91634.1 Reverse transcriptase (RNA-dependent DNA polymerase) [Neorhodopirellula pilleata]
MSKMQKIDTSDRDRVLLSEILPHEVPPRFSLRSVYRRMRGASLTTLDDALFQHQNDNSGPPETVPYTFSLSRGRKTPRDIHVMHPFHYREVVNFYETYATQILSNCMKSKWTLRSPSGIARRAKDIGYQNQQPGFQSDYEGDESPVCYFAYGPFNLLYAFYGSRDYERLESKFRFVRAIDVQSCFGNIYTHSIAWAIRGKANAKRRGDRSAYFTFDARFDSLMRSMNHGETHGILVGPEMSRIFAELILQTVDTAVLGSLGNRIEFGKQCEVRRYLDDFFIFFNETSIADQVEQSIREELKNCKLYINDAKTVETESPFMSTLSALKHELSHLVDDLHESFLRANKEKRPIPKSVCRIAFRKIKTKVAQSGCHYESCVSYVLSILQRKVSAANSSRCCQFVEGGMVSLLSKLLELDFRYQVAIKVATIYQLISDKIHADFDLDPSVVVDLNERIADEVTHLAANAMSRETPPCLPLLVVLIPIAKLDLVHNVNPILAETIWNLSRAQSPPGEVDYFTVVSLLYFCGDRSAYGRLVREIVKAARDFLRKSTAKGMRADCLMLAADLACCPLIEEKIRKGLLRLIFCWVEKSTGVSDALEELAGKSMFFDWDTNVSTTTYLLEKQIPRCYA